MKEDKNLRKHLDWLATMQEFVIVPSVTSQWKQKRTKYLYTHNTPLKDKRHREILDNEIVIEFDNVENGTGKQMVAATVRNLKREGIKFMVFDHNGKSSHIHTWHEQLDKLPDQARRDYKKKFIRAFVPKPYLEYVDMSLTGTHLVALEFTPHWKYGTLKQLVASNHDGTLNPFNAKYLPIVSETRPPEKMVADVSDPVFKSLLLLKFKAGVRNKVILKNFAIFLNNLNISEVEKEELTRMIAKNCVGEPFHSVVAQVRGWRKWAYEHGATNFNKAELLKAIRSHGFVAIMER